MGDLAFRLDKFNARQPRDESGRWTSRGSKLSRVSRMQKAALGDPVTRASDQISQQRFEHRASKLLTRAEEQAQVKKNLIERKAEKGDLSVFDDLDRVGAEGALDPRVKRKAQALIDLYSGADIEDRVIRDFEIDLADAANDTGIGSRKFREKIESAYAAKVQPVVDRAANLARSWMDSNEEGMSQPDKFEKNKEAINTRLWVFSELEGSDVYDLYPGAETATFAKRLKKELRQEIGAEDAASISSFFERALPDQKYEFADIISGWSDQSDRFQRLSDPEGSAKADDMHRRAAAHFKKKQDRLNDLLDKAAPKISGKERQRLRDRRKEVARKEWDELMKEKPDKAKIDRLNAEFNDLATKIKDSYEEQQKALDMQKRIFQKTPALVDKKKFTQYGNLDSLLSTYFRDNLDAKKAGAICGRGWVGMKKPEGKGCKRAKPGAADKQMRVKRKRLGKSPEKPKARVIEGKKSGLDFKPTDPIDLKGVRGVASRIRKGDITAEEIRGRWEQFKNNRDNIKAELGRMKNAEIKEQFFSWHAKKKDELVAFALGSLRRSFEPPGFRAIRNWSVLKLPTQEELDKANIADTDKAVKEWTDEKIKAIADERKAKIERKKKALSNPETFEEFRDLIAMRGEENLSPEQRRRYEQIIADKAKDAETQRQIRQVGQQAKTGQQTKPSDATAAATNSEYKVVKHTKTGKDLHTVKVRDRVERAVYEDHRNKAKELGGYYSKYTKSFHLPDEDSARKFQKAISGDSKPQGAAPGGATSPPKPSETAEEAVARRQREKALTSARKLKAVAASTKEKATADLEADRLTNTRRRAGMALNIQQRARDEIAKAETMERLADAIEGGKVKYLNGVTSKAQIDGLESALRQAVYDHGLATRDKAQKDSMNSPISDEEVEKWTGRSIKKKGDALYSEKRNDDLRQEAKEGRAKAAARKAYDQFNDKQVDFLASIDHAELRAPRQDTGLLRDLAKEGIRVPGTKRIRQKINNLPADGFARFDKPEDVAELRTLVDGVLKKPVSYRYGYERLRDQIKEFDRMSRAGFTTNAEFRAALREYHEYRAGKKEESPEQRIKRLEQDVLNRNRNVGVDFFPTPAKLADRVAEVADIRDGMKVLEPSAGFGRLADAARARGGKVTTVELSSELRGLLKEKGYDDLRDGDFLDYKDDKDTYDRIVMNPPFSKGADIDHVRHAYEKLKPGGKLVAIMSEGPFFRSTKKDVDFRSWLDGKGESEKLPEGTFKESNTGVNTRLVTITKPVSFPKSEATTIIEAARQGGEVPKGYKVKDGIVIASKDESAKYMFAPEWTGSPTEYSTQQAAVFAAKRQYENDSSLRARGYSSDVIITTHGTGTTPHFKIYSRWMGGKENRDPIKEHADWKAEKNAIAVMPIEKRVSSEVLKRRRKNDALASKYDEDARYINSVLKEEGQGVEGAAIAALRAASTGDYRVAAKHLKQNLTQAHGVHAAKDNRQTMNRNLKSLAKTLESYADNPSLVPPRVREYAEFNPVPLADKKAALAAKGISTAGLSEEEISQRFYDINQDLLNLDARVAGQNCGRGWVGMKKPEGKGCKRAKAGSAEKQMRVKRTRLGKSPERPRARTKETLPDSLTAAKAWLSNKSNVSPKKIAEYYDQTRNLATDLELATDGPRIQRMLGISSKQARLLDAHRSAFNALASRPKTAASKAKTPVMKGKKQTSLFGGTEDIPVYRAKGKDVDLKPSNAATLNGEERIKFAQEGLKQARERGDLDAVREWTTELSKAQKQAFSQTRQQQKTKQTDIFGALGQSEFDYDVSTPLFSQRGDGRKPVGGRLRPEQKEAALTEFARLLKEKAQERKDGLSLFLWRCDRTSDGSVPAKPVTPCNESRGWYGTKPGCKRDKAKSAARKAERRAQRKAQRSRASARPRINKEDLKRVRLKDAGIRPGSIGEMSPDQIKVDPGRFQYKRLSNAQGEVGSLSGVKTYDPNLAGIVQAWRDPADGQTYIVNGHNRLGLAKRAGADKIAVRMLDVPDARTARAVGAMSNIAEGRGDALDAAKFFKDSGISREDLERKGIPMRERIATDGLAISKLDDSLYRRTMSGDMPIERAAIIGGAGLSGEQQRSLAKLIDSKSKRKEITNSVLRELVDTAKSAATQTQSTLTLFGEEEIKQSLALEKAQLQARIKARLGREKKLFGTVSKSRAAEDLQRGGNQINRAKSGEISQQAAQTLSTFDQQKNLAGPISSKINEAARRLASGESMRSVEKDLYGQILQDVAA